MDNDKVLGNGLRKAKEMVYAYISDVLIGVCEALVKDAIASYKSPIGSFTGNTITGYSSGVYMNGELIYFYSSSNTKKPPVRAKIRKGKTVYLSPDYEGRNRSVTGKVDTDGKYGHETSLAFLKAYKSKVKNGFEVVTCSGTEYSSFIETKMGGNVLTNTSQNAGSILISKFNSVMHADNI